MSDYNLLNKEFNHICKIIDNNNTGNLCIYIKNIIVSNLKKNKQFDDIVNFIYLSCLKCLEISKKYNKKTYNVHVYLENISRYNFSLSLFKKINLKLSNEFQDVVNIIYLYQANEISITLYNIIKPFIDKDTRKKIIFYK